jgi:hypothetical protein
MQSKALNMSMAHIAEQRASLATLKAIATLVAMGSRAEVQEWAGANPC